MESPPPRALAPPSNPALPSCPSACAVPDLMSLPPLTPPYPAHPAYSPSKGVRCRDLVGHSGSVSCVGANASGSLIVSGAYDRTVRVWDARSGATAHAAWLRNQIEVYRCRLYRCTVVVIVRALHTQH